MVVIIHDSTQRMHWSLNRFESTVRSEAADASTDTPPGDPQLIHALMGRTDFKAGRVTRHDSTEAFARHLDELSKGEDR